jgi:hypothetical protein
METQCLLKEQAGLFLLVRILLRQINRTPQ